MAGKILLPLVAILLTFGVGACGKQESRHGELVVKLTGAAEGAEGAERGLLWGVYEHEIQWLSSAHGIRAYPWDGRSRLSISPEPGDRLIYVGRSAEGVVLVRGEALVGNEPQIIVPLVRIL